MQYSRLKGRVRGMVVRFPTPIQKIDLDTTANWIATVDSDRSITKIRPSFPIPGAELDNVNFVAGGSDEMSSKISGKPSGLQFQFRWDSR
jgi:hypothetical protein